MLRSVWRHNLGPGFAATTHTRGACAAISSWFPVSTRFRFEMMAGDEFESDEAEAGTEGEGGVEEPEGGGGHRFVEAADPADEGVGGEEGEIIKADDCGVDRFRRDLGEEGETHRQQMGEGDAVEKVERDRPEEPDLVPRALGRGSGEEAESAADREA